MPDSTTIANPSSHESADQQSPVRRRTALLLLGLLILAGVAYANAVFHPFVYDDVVLILKNGKIQSLSKIPELIGLGDMVGLGDGKFRLHSRWTRDVTYALEYAAVGTWAPLYHLNNILLHVCIGFLVFTLITRVSGDRMLGWFTAAIFLVHPINTEVVAHISGRRGLLAALFSLIALLLLERYVRRGGLWRVGLAMFALYLGAFSKELAVMAPLAFVLVDFYGRSRNAEQASHSTEASSGNLLADFGDLLVRRKGLYSILAILMLSLTAGLIFHAGSLGLEGSKGYYETTGPGVGLWDRARAAGMGLRLLLVPIGQTVDYSYDALGIAAGGWTMLMSIDVLVLFAAVVLTAVGLWRRHWVGFGGAWFAIFYLPHAGLIQWHEIFNERFLYLASIGFCTAMAAGGIWLARRPGWSRGALVMSAAVLVLLTTGTIRRNEAWSSSINLWESAIARFPTCARAHKALADAYLDEIRPDLAVEHYREAARILPTYKDAQVGVVAALTARGKYREAIDSADQILERWPDDPMALNLKGFIYLTLGHPDKAIEAYQRAVQSDPTFAEGYNNLGQLYVEQGNVDTAIEMYETAIEHDPSLAAAYWNLAVIYRHGLEDEEQAVVYEEKARQLKQLQ